MNISVILKERRRDLGLTLKEIADQMDVSEATVQRWESGDIKSIKIDRVQKLAEILKVDPSLLMGWETKMTYVIKIDGDYYAGKNKKYADLYNVSGMGVVGAEKLTLDEAEKIKEYFEQPGIGRTVEIEEYNPKKFLMDALKEIIVLDQKQREGMDVGFAIKNNAQKAMKLLWEA